MDRIAELHRVIEAARDELTVLSVEKGRADAAAFVGQFIRTHNGVSYVRALDATNEMVRADTLNRFERSDGETHWTIALNQRISLSSSDPKVISAREAAKVYRQLVKEVAAFKTVEEFVDA